MGRSLSAAIAAMQSGQLLEADRQLDRADALVPGDPDVLQLRGALALRRQQFEEAVRLLSEALKLDPDQPATLNNLAEANREMGRPSEARGQLEKALKLAPAEPRLLYNMANVLRDLGERTAAAEHYRQALAAEPRFFEARNNLGSLLAEVGALAEAEAALTQATRLRPRDEMLHANLANVQLRRKNFTDAASTYQTALKLHPGFQDAQAELGRALHGARRSDEGLAAIEQAIAIDTPRPMPYIHRGVVEAELGRFDAAEASFREALKREFVPLAWAQLADINRLTTNGSDIAAMEKGLSDIRDASGRVYLHFALAKAHDKAGDYDAAFTQYKSGNDLKREIEPFSVEAMIAGRKAITGTFTREFFAAKAGLGDDREGPIFIVGMPRSGTTLAEQILASHPDVFGAGELMLMGEIASELGDVEGVEAEEVQTQAGRYLDHQRAVGADVRFVTDKLPGNFANLGLIALLLPKARIVHCRRDPMDTAVSCYLQNFETGQAFASDLDHIARYTETYRMLMDHWSAVLPLPIIDFDYEAVIAEPEPRIRALVEACGLPWDERCLDFHHTERSVSTASKWQARQPLFASSVGAWRRFEKHLLPLKQAIEAIQNNGGAGNG